MNATSMNRFVRPAAIAAICTMLLACGGSKNLADPNATVVASADTSILDAPDLKDQAGSVFDVTYKPETIVVDRATVGKIVGAVSPDGSQWALDASDPQVQKLVPGSVLLLQNLALLKITGVDHQDGVTVVATEPAAVTDAIANGSIHFTKSIDFGAIAAAGLPHDPIGEWLRVHSDVALAEGANQTSGKMGDWSWKLGATPSAGKLSLSVDLEREVSDVKLSLNGDGFVTNFQTTGDMRIVDGNMESMKLVNDNMSGLVNFAWSVAKKSKGVYGLDPSDSVVELPCAFETPLVIGGLPFTLCITESFFIRPGLTSSTIAHGKFHAQYSGSQGVSVGSGAVSEDGSPEQSSSVDDSMSTSLIPTGFVAAIAMPKVELKTGPADVLHELSEIAHGAPQSFAEKAAGALAKTSLGKKIVDATKSAFDSGIGAYVELILSTGMTGSGSMGVTTCTQTTFLVTFKAKAEAKLLGVKIAATGDDSASKDLYKSFTADPDTPFCRGASTGG